MSPQHGFGSGTDWAPAYARPVSPPAYPTEFDGEFKSEYAANPVAVRLAGGGVRKIATAGKPDCYRAGSAATLAVLCSALLCFCSALLLLCSALALLCFCSVLLLLCSALALFCSCSVLLLFCSCSVLLLLCSSSALPCFASKRAKAQTTQNATWVQAERRWRAVGRAAWMPRERRKDMDVRSARAHGASPSLRYSDEGGTKPGARTLGYLVSFQVTRRRRNRSGVSQSPICRTAITWRIQISSCTPNPVGDAGALTARAAVVR
jgi:hypothetical protein